MKEYSTEDAFRLLIADKKLLNESSTLRSHRKRFQEGTITIDTMERTLQKYGFVVKSEKIWVRKE